MRSYFFYLLCLFAVISPLRGQSPFNSFTLKSEIKKHLPASRSLSDSQLMALAKGEIISQVQVRSKEKTQSLDLWVGGVHPQNCKRALRKIAHYESYPELLSFIKKSQYHDEHQRWTLKLDHVLMPFAMYLDFKIPRIKKEGSYSFTFEKGFLTGLQGQVIAQELNSQCMLSLSGQWSGPHSKIPDIIFSTFVQTLAELGLKNLIRSTKI